jgi:hypothetical protein
MIVGEFAAVLVIVTFAPPTAPPLVGANVTLRAALAPAGISVPLGIPLALNPVPVTVIWEIVMLELPLLIIDVGRELEPSSSTLPNDRLGGFAETPDPTGGVGPWVSEDEGPPPQALSTDSARIAPQKTSVRFQVLRPGKGTERLQVSRQYTTPLID